MKKKWFTAAVLALCAVVFVVLLVTANKGRVHRELDAVYETLTYQRAEVLNISRDTVSQSRYSPDGIDVGSQLLLCRLLSGPHAGEVVEVELFVSTFQGPKAAVGDKLVVLEDDSEDGALQAVSFYHHDRTLPVWLVLGLFLAVTVLVGGLRGLKSLLGLGVTVVCLIWIFCPLLMKGYDPVPLAFGLCVFMTVVSFVILGGTGRKVLCAILGTVAGMGLAALFGTAAQALCKINGYSLYEVTSEVSALVNLQTLDFDIHITGLLTAGILIASLGAVMDVAMSLSSAISELKTVNPGLGFKALWKSGMNIGRDMVGTMTNTLILAFVGTSLVTFLYLWSLGPGYLQLMSSAFLGAEVISAISSSIGVILAVPLTAAIGAGLYGKQK